MALKASKETLADVVAMVLTLEGTWSDDPQDRGGFHQWGISSRYFIEAADPGFTLKDAFPIYEKFVHDSRMLEIMVASNNRELGYLHFSFAFNIGAKRAVEVLQSWLYTVTSNRSIKIDGLYGPQTESHLIRVTQAMSPDKAVEYLKLFYSGWYSAHAAATSQKHYMKGWINRLGMNFDAWFDDASAKREKVLQWFDNGMSDEKLAEQLA